MLLCRWIFSLWWSIILSVCFIRERRSIFVHQDFIRVIFLGGRKKIYLEINIISHVEYGTLKMSGWNRRWTGRAAICGIRICRHSFSNDSGCYTVKTVLLNQGHFMITNQAETTTIIQGFSVKQPRFSPYSFCFFISFHKAFRAGTTGVTIWTQTMHTLFHKKRNPSKIVFPFFGSVISPNLPRSLSTDPWKFNRKTIKKRRKKTARLSTLSMGALRKDGASRNFVVQAMARKIKTSVSGPKKTSEKKGWWNGAQA